MAIPTEQSLSAVTEHALNPATGPGSSIGRTVTRTLAAQPTRSLLSKATPNQDLATYIRSRAVRYGLDPQAVLAVASKEGLGGGVGDSGSSFGPFQLHYGGAYPSFAPRGVQASQAWASSPAGVDYALQQMAKVAEGLKGQAAIRAIVSRFERPADIPGEIAAASSAYGGDSAIDTYKAGYGTSGPNRLLSATTQQAANPTFTSSYTPGTYEYGSSGGTAIDTSGMQTGVQKTLQPFSTKPGIDPNLAPIQNAWAKAVAALNNPTAFLGQAGKIATAEIAPQVQQLLAAGKIGENNLIQFNRGTQQLLGQLPAEIGQIYDPAIAESRQISQSAGAALAAASPTPAQAAMLQQIGQAPPEQLAQLATQAQQSYGVGGAALTNIGNFGAQTLEGQKAAAQAYAKQIPALAQIQAGQALSNYQSGQLAAVGKVLAQQPALAAKLFSTIVAGKGAAAKQFGSYITQAQNVALKKAGLNLKAAGLNLQAIKDSNTAVYQNNQLILGANRADTASRIADNQAIHWAATDSTANDRNSLYDARTQVMVTNNAANLALKQQNALGFQILIGPDGKPYIQPNAGYRAKLTPSGAVVTWKPSSGGSQAARKGWLPGWKMTSVSVGRYTDSARKFITVHAGLPQPKKIQGTWQYPSGTSQQDLYDPTVDPGTLLKGGVYKGIYGLADNTPNQIPPTPYNEVVNQLWQALPVKSQIAEDTIIKMVQANSAYNQPGHNGRPYEKYADYLTGAQATMAHNPSFTAQQLVDSLLTGGPYYPDRKLVVRAANTIFKGGQAPWIKVAPGVTAPRTTPSAPTNTQPGAPSLIPTTPAWNP